MQDYVTGRRHIIAFPFAALVPLQQTKGQASYPPVKSLSATPFYTDRKSSEVSVDALEANRSDIKPLLGFVKAIETASERWLLSSDRSAASWASQQLTSWAKADALLGDFNDQGKATRRFCLTGIAVAFLTLRNSISAADRTYIAAWLSRVSEACLEDEFRLHNNHLNWLAASTVCCGIAASDQKLIEHGTSSIVRAIDSISSDGSLSLEVARGQRALYYHSFALSPTLLTASALRENGVDIFGFNNNGIERLLNFVVASIQDTTALSALAGTTQLWAGTTQNTVPWIEMAHRRFGNSWISQKVLQLRPVRYAYLGGNQTALWTGSIGWLRA